MSEVHMTREEYLTIQTQLVTLSRVALSLSDEDLKKFIEAGEHSMTIAPILDPTLYMMGGQKLRGIMGLAQAMRKFRRSVTECWDAIEQGERKAQGYRAIGVGR